MPTPGFSDSRPSRMADSGGTFCVTALAVVMTSTGFAGFDVFQPASCDSANMRWAMMPGVGLMRS